MPDKHNVKMNKNLLTFISVSVLAVLGCLVVIVVLLLDVSKYKTHKRRKRFQYFFRMASKVSIVLFDVGGEMV